MEVMPPYYHHIIITVTWFTLRPVRHKSKL
jgi:hypothetical protein